MWIRNRWMLLVATTVAMTACQSDAPSAPPARPSPAVQSADTKTTEGAVTPEVLRKVIAGLEERARGLVADSRGPIAAQELTRVKEKLGRLHAALARLEGGGKSSARPPASSDLTHQSATAMDWAMSDVVNPQGSMPGYSLAFTYTESFLWPYGSPVTHTHRLTVTRNGATLLSTTTTLNASLGSNQIDEAAQWTSSVQFNVCGYSSAIVEHRIRRLTTDNQVIVTTSTDNTCITYDTQVMSVPSGGGGGSSTTWWCFWLVITDGNGKLISRTPLGCIQE